MKTILVNLLNKNKMEDLKLRRKYEVNEPMYHIITGRLEVYDTLLDLLKEEKMKDKNYSLKDLQKIGAVNEKEVENMKLAGVQALKTFDIEKLLKRQAMLDKKFDEKKTPRKRDKNKIYIAYFAELGELLQELKSEWNYWKNGTNKPDKQKVLEEMSDCLHFLLSFFNQDEFWKRGSLSPQEYKEDMEGFENALIYLSFLETAPVLKIFGAMLIVAGHVGATEEEFLQVHHEKWLKNMNERTKESY